MNKWSMEPKTFTGTLGIDEHTTDVTFTVRVDKAGHAHIEIARLPFNCKTLFLQTYFDKVEEGRFARFILVGVASDRASFECDNIILTTLKTEHVLADGCKPSDEEPRYLCTIGPQASYSLARITMVAPRAKDPRDPEVNEGGTWPELVWRVKGFDSYQFLAAKCPLGVIQMGGGTDMNGKDEISGFLRMCAVSAPAAVEAWRQEAEALCSHIYHVMSFAACTMLGVPLREFYCQDNVVIEVYSKRGQQRSVTPVFHCLNLQAIFDCAVRSHFEPAFELKNLAFAIQWFAMHGDYRESMLITSMTVLENLIDSNLTDDDTKILSDKAFEKLRKRLSTVVKELAHEWSDDEEGRDSYVKEFNERFSDLKRRSLLDKITLLAKRWGVDLSGVPEDFIKEAKRARDHVVHRGHYLPKTGATRDLHDHVLTAREVVVRFILTALRYEGTYLSYLGGYHTRSIQKVPKDLGQIAGTPAPSGMST